jgi:hypothetical protein
MNWIVMHALVAVIVLITYGNNRLIRHVARLRSFFLSLRYLKEVVFSG